MISTLTSSMQDQDQIFSLPQLRSVQPHIAARPSPSPLPSPLVAQSSPSTVRKYSAQFHKNGLPIKSALKSPVVVVDAKISPVALCRPSSIRSHSSPTLLTSPKYVHFNTQLEHVRLFLQGEMPSCVSERETITDSRQDNRSTSDIKLTLPNWTSASVDSFRAVNIDSGAAPMRVENMILSEDQSELEGKILVLNIAFHKFVSVRYTVDFWQSYTEVNAEFEESILGSTVDRFSFVVPLDMERSAVEKTFCMAVRYQVNGREFWDSNNGMNYHVECKRVVVVAPPTASDLSKHMNTLLLGSPLPDYSKPVLKKLANRYDLSSSLSAASSQPIAIPTRTPNVKVEVPMVTSTPASQTAYRASEYISPSPQNYHHSLYASSPKFLNSYLSAASPPDHFNIGYGLTSKRGKRNSWNVEMETPSSSSPLSLNRSQSLPAGLYSSSPSKGSAPISIPNTRMQASRPAVGSSGYFDLVDRYCFYESSPNISPYNSYPNSPPAPCIRG
ncbi:hypothetical protein BGZ58_009897 [Dissophora ornata]|nr:hypothetical protein BGZ58_009897 [Dissophora ornata]